MAENYARNISTMCVSQELPSLIHQVILHFTNVILITTLTPRCNISDDWDPQNASTHLIFNPNSYLVGATSHHCTLA